MVDRLRLLGTVCVGALILIMSLAGPADAFRSPGKAEFRAIAAAVEKNPDGSYYCAERETTWASTLRPRWALAEMRSNCGLGSQTVRFFLKRRTGQKGWRVAERHYERLGMGEGVPCGSRRTPPDIRCGPLVVHDRPAHSAASRRCPANTVVTGSRSIDGERTRVTSTHGVTCDRARRVVREHGLYIATGGAYEVGGTYFLGRFRCVVKKPRPVRARCVDGQDRFTIAYRLE